MSSYSIELREAVESDIPALRKLLNLAYQELGDRGWNYTAVDQDENKTRERMQEGKAFVLILDRRLIATILYFKKNYFTQKNTAYVGQFAVLPEFKRQGLGTRLMNHCEDLARQENLDGLQLDTAQPATHLVQLYLKRGYRIVGEMQWEGKTYKSYIFEKEFKTK